MPFFPSFLVFTRDGDWWAGLTSPLSLVLPGDPPTVLFFSPVVYLHELGPPHQQVFFPRSLSREHGFLCVGIFLSRFDSKEREGLVFSLRTRRGGLFFFFLARRPPPLEETASHRRHFAAHPSPYLAQTLLLTLSS